MKSFVLAALLGMSIESTQAVQVEQMVAMYEEPTTVMGTPATAADEAEAEVASEKKAEDAKVADEAKKEAKKEEEKKAAEERKEFKAA